MTWMDEGSETLWWIAHEGEVFHLMGVADRYSTDMWYFTDLGDPELFIHEDDLHTDQQSAVKAAREHIDSEIKELERKREKLSHLKQDSG